VKSIIPSGYFGNSVNNLYHIKNFVEKKDIEEIYEFSKNIKIFDGAQNSEIWKNRVCSGSEIHKRNKTIYFKLFNIYGNIAKTFIENKFNFLLSSPTPSIIIWNVGDEQPPHADKEHPDGRDNGTPLYDISSLIYINDDYEGGEIYFPKQGMEIKPKAGDFVCFPGDKEYIHGVKKITHGKRFTIPLFFTAINKLGEE
jgi:predicted 2-oxoglutarate/Fe(II)-dependent dioxygenase YbiX